MKKNYYILFTLILTIILLFSFSTFSFCAYPKLVSKLIDAFNKIQTYIVAISTPAAAISIGAGFLMQKFSFGDDEKIRTGKKLVRTSIVCYAFILLLDLILSAIESLVT
jgi:hypothetical protein